MMKRTLILIWLAFVTIIAVVALVIGGSDESDQIDQVMVTVEAHHRQITFLLQTVKSLESDLERLVAALDAKYSREVPE